MNIPSYDVTLPSSKSRISPVPGQMIQGCVNGAAFSSPPCVRLVLFKCNPECLHLCAVWLHCDAMLLKTMAPGQKAKLAGSHSWWPQSCRWWPNQIDYRCKLAGFFSQEFTTSQWDIAPSPPFSPLWLYAKLAHQNSSKWDLSCCAWLHAWCCHQWPDPQLSTKAH